MPSLLPTFTTLLRLFSLLSVLTISSLAGLLYTYQGKLIYPASLPPGSREDKTRPDAFRLPFEEEWLVTPDGEKLHAWYIGASPEEKRSVGAGEGKTQRVVVIMFQANAGKCRAQSDGRLAGATLLANRKTGSPTIQILYCIRLWPLGRMRIVTSTTLGRSCWAGRVKLARLETPLRCPGLSRLGFTTVTQGCS